MNHHLPATAPTTAATPTTTTTTTTTTAATPTTTTTTTTTFSVANFLLDRLYRRIEQYQERHNILRSVVLG